MRVRGAVEIALALLVLGAGCSKKPEIAFVERIVLSLPPSLDSNAEQREKLRGDVRAQLKQDDLTYLTEESGKATHLVRVELTRVLNPQTRDSEPAVVVQLRALSDSSVLEAVGRGTSDSEAFVLEGFQDAWSIITTRRRLQVASQSDVLAALKSTDLRVRAAAISLIGERELTAGVEPLCEILEKEDSELLVLRAVGALIALGDPRAIDPLIALARNKDPRFVLQVVFAVGAIGGQTARGYLVTLASGHPVEQVRQGAEDALREMERRESP